MKFQSLKQAITTNLFTLADVKKHFPESDDKKINMQLSRFKKRGLISSLKRGIYCFDLSQVNDLQLANKLHQPSYVSLETALHYYGIIPDVPQKTTCVSPTGPKEFKTKFGTFIYHKIKKDLFWGYNRETNGQTDNILIAEKEKALLDYFYLRKIKSTADLRLDLANFNNKTYRQYADQYPNWVRQIKLPC